MSNDVNEEKQRPCLVSKRLGMLDSYRVPEDIKTSFKEIIDAMFYPIKSARNKNNDKP